MFGGPNGTDCIEDVYAAKRRGVQLQPEDEPPENVPQAVITLWQMYQEIRSGVAPGMMGAAPITWQDFAAYQQCIGLELDDWTITQLRVIDRLLIAAGRKTNDGD